MKIKSWIATFLLLSFVVLLTPRSLWHNCAHESALTYHHRKSVGLSFEKKVPNCDFCDYTLSLAEEALSFLRIRKRIAFSENQINFSSLYVQCFDNQELRRGPPVM